MNLAKTAAELLQQQQQAADLKKLLKKSTSVGIKSVYAKYNSLNQLSCTLCAIPIKSDLLWSAHIKSKRHVELLSKATSSTPAAPRPVSHAPLTEAPAPALKRPATGGLISADYLDDDDDEQVGSDIAVTISEAPASKRVKFADADVVALEHTAIHEEDNMAIEDEAAGLPADFFDPHPTSSTFSGSTAGNSGKPNKKDDLPVGFFDDPDRDAAARHVKKDEELDKEWASFQKEIQQETVISEALVNNDELENTLKRHQEEEEHQKQLLHRVEELRRKQSEIAAQKKHAEPSVSKGFHQDEDDGDEDDESEDVDGFVDWRRRG